MKTMQEIEAFEYYYSVQNVYESGIPRYFQTIEHAYGYVITCLYPSYWGKGVHDYAEVSDDDLFTDCKTPKSHVWYDNHAGKYSWDSKRTFRKGSKPFLVKNNLGAVIPASAFKNVEPAHETRPAKTVARLERQAEGRAIREAHTDYVDSLRRIKKGSADKIKYDFSVSYCDYGMWGDGWSSNLSHHHKCRTTHEKRWNEAHDDEYGVEYGLWTRKARTGRKLPSLWEDPGNASWDTRKSWKHNSKRKKQWKTRDEKSSL